MNKTLDEFTGLYPVSKTLRFELKPQGRTLEWIEHRGILNQDEHRADSYKVAKKLLDHYTKHFIDECLSKLKENPDDFVEAIATYRDGYLKPGNDATAKKTMEKQQERLRKLIAKTFDKRLSGDEQLNAVRDYLCECARTGAAMPAGMTIDDCMAILNEFDKYTTYFSGFNTNRENMYTDAAESTAIAYRLIHDNLPKYLSNMLTWDKVKTLLSVQIAQLEKDMASELNGKPLTYFFEHIASYVDCLTQADITRYNTLIGGRSEGAVKVQGLNEYINLYNQRVERKHRLPKMVELYKMILSDRATLSWLPESFSDDNELLEAVNKTYQEIVDNVFCDKDEAPSLKTLLTNLADYDINGIYIKNDTTLTDVMKQAYGEWDKMRKALETAYEAAHPRTAKTKAEKYETDRAKWIKSFDSFSLGDIYHYTGSKDIVTWYQHLWTTAAGKPTVFDQIEADYQAAKDLLNADYKGNLKNDSPAVELIKTLLDSLKNLQRLALSLKGSGEESGRDGRFYAEWGRLVTILDQLTSLYNMVRNYVTQKPYSTEKFKLNFGKSTLLNGWDRNKETDYLGVLPRKEGCYYLGIIANENKDKHLFPDDMPHEGDCYEKIVYKLLPGPNKMLPKVFFAKGNIDYYGPSEQLMQHYNAGTHKKGNSNFSVDDCHELIDFFKSSIQKNGDWKQFGFDFSETSSYEDISGFYREVERQGYKITFQSVSTAYIDQLINDGKLYLFQIYNKDFSPYSKGTPNMHTLYWKALFDNANLNNSTNGKGVIYKLNGQAELFFRRKSITYTPQQEEYGFHYEELKDKFAYPIYKDRRYAVDKFQLHVPITMNFKYGGQAFDFNAKVRNFIRDGGVEHIIGIDRGERHLLYLSMIDLKGNIVKQFTLNDIITEYNQQTHTTHYHDLLDRKEKDRDEARKSWKTIEGIKDLKEGYLSQVVHIISELIVKYNAIVVLEDLNFGFKRGRQKVEKQVYQKFEKMLIDKLNYLVDKKKPQNDTGGLMRALQLTAPFESFAKLGKQSGFLFYIPASLTSKIDPVTGFANYINTKYESQEKASPLLSKFKCIRYNEQQDYFEFRIDPYSAFNAKAVGRQQWTICSYGNRIRTFRNSDKNNQWDNEEVNITKDIQTLLDKYSIEWRSGNDLKPQLTSATNLDASFYKEMLYLLGLVLQMRNSITGTNEDYIISPVADAQGNFFCSNDKRPTLPTDADANGAYNIARKGLWVVQQIKAAPDPSKVKLAMSNEEWMDFAQNKPYLN